MNIGFLGTGLMGEPMAQRLLAANLAVTVYNRTPSKVASLAKAGAAIANSPAELIRTSDCIILMLSDAIAISEVLLSEASQAQLAGRTVISMSTISPTQSRDISDRILAASAEYLEAPVLGSIPEAKTGNLIVMVGSTPQQFQQWQGLLQHLGSEPRYIGTVGMAAALKLALNQLIASLTTAFSLSLGLVERYGVDTEAFMQILRTSALYATTFDKKLSRMLEGNYDNPNFPTKHLLKDTKLFLSEAETLGLQSQSLDGVRQILEQAIALGLADADYSALFAAVNPPTLKG
ncbi:NAD(P)-dependent oxidoreductase [Tumidithrix elongata RA019]|uniref:NAD(P)-dependent oxidoreductase n=1 Tax=Tumidithrix elongata BACA0141 TaxID=2716417 RepID=A0AAW9Q4N2_9CYAN|nr:NAD(P)-dependent oxidoreductase [Tumidithrix elongata RA019]